MGVHIFHKIISPKENREKVTGARTNLLSTLATKVTPCYFCLFPKLRGCRYETIEEMKEAATKVIDTITQEDFQGAFQKLLERYNKCIVAGADYFEGDLSFMCVLSIKVPIRKKSGNLFNDPRVYIYIYIYMCVCVCVCVCERQRERERECIQILKRINSARG